MQYTVITRTVQCSAIQFNAVQCRAVQRSAVQYSAVQYVTAVHVWYSKITKMKYNDFMTTNLLEGKINEKVAMFSNVRFKGKVKF